jgi:Flp pilus assembly protein TadB
MKTTLTILAAVVMPGGLIILAVGLATFYLTRHRARQKAAGLQLPAAC